MRLFLFATLGLLGALPGLAHAAAAFDVDHATRLWLATLSAPARARSDAYFEGGEWLALWNTVFSVALCWFLLRVRLLPKVRGAMHRRGWRPWLGVLACALVFIAADSLLSLPWTFYTAYWRERQYGLMNQSVLAWLGDQAIGFVLGAVLGSVLLLVIYAVIRKYPKHWWLIGTGVVGAAIAFLALITPVFIVPLFNTQSELPDGAVRARVVAMARAYNVPSEHIYLVDESRQSDRISANVSGIGPTIRISLNDNLLKKTSVAETAAVMGHELGHYVLGHVWRTIVVLTLLMGLLLWLASRIAPAMIRYGGQRWDVRGLADPASLPVLAGVLSVLTLLAMPLTNTLIRIDESEADAFGLAAAREPDGFASAAMRLSAYRKIAPGPLEEMLFFDHPSGQTRVRMAMQWKKDHVPGATEVVPPPLPDPKP
ncbi:peptidase [Novosphingobium fuchskuhlense]|uniref:Peptidase n=2 Tax=Novosphingobium fuchskuhlense TaxID=1117702 RepID=A0A117UYF5_9SPHN|nr:peptidase [Novosphingobium fuchskuhlense]